MKVSNSVVIVTGAAQGLGLAMTKELSDAGANVFGIDRNTDAIKDAKEQASNAKFLDADISIEQQCEEVVQTVLSTTDRIDVLINNAAVLRDQTLASKLGGKVRKHSLDSWHTTIATNLTGTFLMAREVATVMIDAGKGGLIINMSSISRGGNSGQSAYAASKAGVVALTTTWARELAPYKIRSVAIAPGFIETPMTDRIPPMFVKRIHERTPVGRFGTPEEFAMTAKYVIENEYINGTVIEVDGGMSF